MDIDCIPTPAFLVDLDRVTTNAAMACRRATELGVRLRPHAKTHKCVELARLQTEPAAPCLTVSTLAEAARFAEAGFRDICWALPLAACHVDSALEVARSCTLAVLADHPQTVATIQRRAAARSQIISVWLKVDCGYHRAGIAPRLADARELANRLHDGPGTRFAGLLAHAGHSYHARRPTDITRVAREERDRTVNLAHALRETGTAVPAVSIGSTPTLVGVDHLDGVDEIRPGNYLFFDRSQAAIGSCTLDDVAVTVSTTVIGRYPERCTAILDAGALALSKDPGEGCVDFGDVLDLDGTPLPGLHLTSLSQEHGKLVADPGIPLPALHRQLRIRPNHSCLSAALFSEYHIHRAGHVVDVWHPVRGWTAAHARRGA